MKQNNKKKPLKIKSSKIISSPKKATAPALTAGAPKHLSPLWEVSLKKIAEKIYSGSMFGSPDELKDKLLSGRKTKAMHALLCVKDLMISLRCENEIFKLDKIEQNIDRDFKRFLSVVESKANSFTSEQAIGAVESRLNKTISRIEALLLPGYELPGDPMKLIDDLSALHFYYYLFPLSKTTYVIDQILDGVLLGLLNLANHSIDKNKYELPLKHRTLRMKTGYKSITDNLLKKVESIIVQREQKEPGWIDNSKHGKNVYVKKELIKTDPAFSCDPKTLRKYIKLAIEEIKKGKA